MHGVLWRDISLCTDTHNNESAKLGHHNSCNSFPGESTTIAWQNGIYPNHCISRPAHYSFVMAALCCAVSLPLHSVFALTCAGLCVQMSLCVLMSLFSHLCHTYDLIAYWQCMRLYYTSQRSDWIYWFSTVCLLIHQATLGQPIIHSEDHTIHHVRTSACVSLCASLIGS